MAKVNTSQCPVSRLGFVFPPPFQGPCIALGVTFLHSDFNPYKSLLCLLQVTQASKVWGEVPLPEDLEANKDVRASQSLLDDDEDFAADEASGGWLSRGWLAANHGNSCPQCMEHNVL